MVIKNPPKISPGLIFGGGLIIGMIFVLRIRGAYFRGGGLIFGGGGAYYRDFTVSLKQYKFIKVFLYVLNAVECYLPFYLC